MAVHRGRKAAWAAGAGLAVVLGIAGLFWKPMALQYLIRGFRTDRASFTAALVDEHQGLRGQALQAFLATDEGKETLSRELVYTVLEALHIGQMARKGIVVSLLGSSRLEDCTSVLIWIGPKTRGFQPVGDNTAVHRLMTGPDSGGCRVVEGEELRRCHAINKALGTFESRTFTMPEHPSFRFTILPGDEAVAAFEQKDWHEKPPNRTMRVCLGINSTPPK